MRSPRPKVLYSLVGVVAVVALLAVVALHMFSGSAKAQNCKCNRTITADVVALDQAFFNNRLGAFQAGGMIFALKGDVVSNDGSKELKPGKVMLRPGKRARPMVLRMNVDDCLQVNFTNLLANQPVVSNTVLPRNAQDPYNPNIPKFGGWNPDPSESPDSQSATRLAGVHAMGMQMCSAGSQTGIKSDASWVKTISVSAQNPSSR